MRKPIWIYNLVNNAQNLKKSTLIHVSGDSKKKLKAAYRRNGQKF